MRSLLLGPLVKLGYSEQALQAMLGSLKGQTPEDIGRTVRGWNVSYPHARQPLWDMAKKMQDPHALEAAKHLEMRLGSRVASGMMKAPSGVASHLTTPISRLRGALPKVMVDLTKAASMLGFHPQQLISFVKTATALMSGVPRDYYTTHLEALEKMAFDWKKFREGVSDEGVPLTGATIGAALGGSKRLGQIGGLRGAALGYAAGSGLSILRSKLKGEKPSMGRKVLALSGLGYGMGGLAHAGLEAAVKAPATRAGREASAKVLKWFPAHGKETWQGNLLEEGIPAAGAILGTGVAYGGQKKGTEQK